MELKTKPRQRGDANATCRDDLSQCISPEFIPTVRDIQNADLARWFGVIIPDADPQLWLSVASHLPPRGAPFWGVAPLLGGSYGYRSFELAISGAFGKVARNAANGTAVGVRIRGPVPVPDKTVWSAIVILPVEDRLPSWSALVATKLGTWQPIIERMSREIAVSAAVEFCQRQGFCGGVTVYPPPIP